MSTILIADDDAGIRKLLRRVLEKNGNRVIEARNGQEATRQVRDQHPDLLITDLIMPEKEGIETIGDLKICAPDLKVIVISGGGRIQAQNYLAIASCLGVAATFEKPIDLTALAVTVARLIGSGDAAKVSTSAA